MAEYDATAIEVLEGLEHVRKRPSMYIGSKDSKGLTHLLWEVVDNSVDEAMAGHATAIDVTLHADGSVDVVDDGRGIPVDIESRTGLPGVITVLTKLGAGGKFGQDGGYKVSGGLHGVGASVVNALSDRMDVVVTKGGQEHHISFQAGVPGHFDGKGKFTPSVELKTSGRKSKSGPSGTRVQYWPTYELFDADATVTLDDVLERARNTAFLTPGLKLTVTDLRGDKPVVEAFQFDGGLTDFAEYLTKGEALCPVVTVQGTGTFSEIVTVVKRGEDTKRNEEVAREVELDVALRWVAFPVDDTELRSFANTVSTPLGGTHVVGFERALVRVVNEQLREFRVLKANEESAVKDDVLEGLVAIVSVKLPEPDFKGQTKGELGNAPVRGITYELVKQGLIDWFTAPRNKREAKATLERIAAASRARRAAKQAQQAKKKKAQLEQSSGPTKLVDCRTKDPDRAELYLVEGDSALGTCKMARKSEFQALLPLRGKILNTFGKTEKQMLDNRECAAIISAVGAGAGSSFDLSQIRFGKLCLLMDADVDGSHIRILLLTLIYRYMRPMLDAGRVFVAMPPLYRLKVAGSGEVYYVHTDEEREARVREIESKGKRVIETQRYKGLGEMDAEQMEETTLDPDRRVMKRVTVADAELMAQMFDTLMGSSAELRRTFIEERAALLDRDMIDA